MNKINKTISVNSSIKETLRKMNNLGEKCLLVVDKSKFIGTLSDGDIRKALLKNISLNKKIKNIYNQNAYYIFKKNYNEENLKKTFLNKKFDIIPILNDDKSIYKIIKWDEIFKIKRKKTLLKLPIVIMAGGKGSRLKPFTEVLPKPLIPLNNKTVVEHIIDSFKNSGIKEFYISINFKGKILKAFFEELNPKLIIKFIEENKPLGTAGSLYKLKEKISSTFFVTNCDVIFKFDFTDLINFHKNNHSDMTLVVSANQFEVPYGACELNQEGFLKKIIEKPKLDYLVNTGLYVFEPSILNYIPKNKFLNMNDLIQKLIKDNKKLSVFPINNDTWLDLGQWDEYKNAVKKLK